MHEERLKVCGTKIIANSNLDGIAYPVGTNVVVANKIATTMAEEITKLWEDDAKDGISLWCRGSSGAIMAALVSSHLDTENIDVDIQHVKKNGESSHSTNDGSYKRNFMHIIVDDFISTGDTMRKIILGMMKSVGGSYRQYGNVSIKAIVVSGSYGDYHRITPYSRDACTVSQSESFQNENPQFHLEYIVCNSYCG